MSAPAIRLSDAARKVLQEAARAAGFKSIHAHALRHTAASLAVAGGSSLVEGRDAPPLVDRHDESVSARRGGEARRPWVRYAVAVAPVAPRPRQTVYLETNAINHLLRPHHDAVRRKLLTSSRLRPIVSAMTIAEIAATSNAQRRERLLSFAIDLASKGKMVADRNDVIRGTIAGFETGDRRRVFRGFSARVVRRRLSSPQPVDAADRDVAYDGNQGFCTALDHGVEDLEGAGLAPTNEREWVEGGARSEDAAKKFLMSLGVQEPTIGTLAAAVIADQAYVRPLRAAMLSTLAAAGMRRLPPPPHGKPVSGVDLTHGLYLAGCDVFVTEDRELQRLVRAVADHLAHHPRVARVADIATL